MKWFGDIWGQLTLWQRWGVATFVLIGLLHPFIANDNYIICYDGDEILWADKERCQKGLSTFIPYRYSTIDKNNRKVSPWSKQNVDSILDRHWLGTDKLGRDVLAGILAGVGIALKIGLSATLLALMIGIILGYISGYLGDTEFKVRWWQLMLFLFLSTVSLFYWHFGGPVVRVLAATVFVSAIVILSYQSSQVALRRDVVAIPFDLIIMRVIEIFKSIPEIFIVIVLVGLFRNPSVFSLVVIIAFIKWPSATRHIRGEVLKLKDEHFVMSAKALGLSRYKVFRDHILPLALSPAIVISAFGISSAVLLESTLSFLGLGLGADAVSWGTILSQARENVQYWWLAVFPGLAIYLVVLLFNSIGDTINKSLQGFD